MTQKFETRILHSLEKVFPDEELQAAPGKAKGAALLNEVFSYQVAYRSQHLIPAVKVKAESELGDLVTLRSVGLVPSELPIYSDHDDDVLRSTPGLYPDPLLPLTDGELRAYPGQWRSVWVTVDPKGMAKPGVYPITVRFATETGETLGEERFELEIIGAELPKQQLLHTQWFHADCLATQYGVEVFSERHWELLEQYIQTAADHGINMLLTPIFTPPLDTEVGGERPTVQLVDVEVTGEGQYRFGFDRLKRWVDLCQKCGIEYFEFSHLFTQWGAKHAPKIMAVVNGELKRIFGWETDASGEEYHTFLKQLLPQLKDWIHENGIENRSYFHISDEPSLEHIEYYASAKQMVNELLSGFPVIDALSDYDFYEKGLVQTPIPASNHIEPFLENNVTPLWTYYCCSQYKNVANRFFCMPSARNRILGYQLYKFDNAGFLQWGYNFWYTQYSKKVIDPFRVTDAGGGFPSGDAFLVYPGEQGPIESIRMEVMQEALQDLRLLRQLEEWLGRDAVLAALEEGLEEPMTFSSYPKDAEWILSKREWMNEKVKEHIGNRAVIS
ncbi:MULTISPECIES: DUF4091 domain-containing protein [Paenibacillus]|uniref:Glycoside hydrolase 123 catalytic domain-containing protein n=1 Tax=Paenibacillus albilobatus TaxID=2716884 RepID=A0A919XLX4_9BACL|nr:MULTISPECIES: DUF4091 domain-containing protein [Paenibacillus]GIO32598.1 hypothetical protein J2TS6_37390 [Paenibacillus albilobatus]